MTSLGRAVLDLDVDASGLSRGLDDAEALVKEKMLEIGEGMVLAVSGPILAIGEAASRATRDVGGAFSALNAGAE